MCERIKSINCNNFLFNKLVQQSRTLICIIFNKNSLSLLKHLKSAITKYTIIIPNEQQIQFDRQIGDNIWQSPSTSHASWRLTPTKSLIILIHAVEYRANLNKTSFVEVTPNSETRAYTFLFTRLCRRGGIPEEEGEKFVEMRRDTSPFTPAAHPIRIRSNCAWAS